MPYRTPLDVPEIKELMTDNEMYAYVWPRIVAGFAAMVAFVCVGMMLSSIHGDNARIEESRIRASPDYRASVQAEQSVAKSRADEAMWRQLAGR